MMTKFEFWGGISFYQQLQVTNARECYYRNASPYVTVYLKSIKKAVSKWVRLGSVHFTEPINHPVYLKIDFSPTGRDLNGVWTSRKFVSMQNLAIQSLPACLAQIKVHVIVLFSHGLNFFSPNFKKASAYFFPPAWWVSLISPALLQNTTLKDSLRLADKTPSLPAALPLRSVQSRSGSFQRQF